MNTHPYLRAYMAGIPVPTVLLLGAFATYCVARFGVNVDVPVERALVFPLALVPNLWGLWNMLYVALRERRHLPLGIHGALLPLILMPCGLLVLTVVGIHVSSAMITAGALGFPVGLIVYYLIWKYVVGFLNQLVGVA
jgi:hypothetical protein